LDSNQKTGTISGVSDLIITDEVDITKPIWILARNPFAQSDEDLSVRVDITKDGTVFDDFGLPVDATKGEGEMWIGGDRDQNRWLWAPGIVQSLVCGSGNISDVEYTDIYGQTKHISNFYLYATPEYALESGISIDNLNPEIDISTKLLSNGFSYSGSFDWSDARGEAKGFSPSGKADNESDYLVDYFHLKTCQAIYMSEFYPMNIDEYASLRSDASTEASILRKVLKGEKLERVDTGVYVTGGQCYDLCASEKPGSTVDQLILSNCINDNSIWLKLRTPDGIEGYISTKFLGLAGFLPSDGSAWVKGDTESAYALTDIGQPSLTDFSTLGTCINDVGSVFYPTNIDEYVSLRLDPATDARMIGKVFKGEKLERADLTVYTGLNSPTQNQCYELCKAESETGRINTSNLAICIKDNSLWLKLRTSDGVEGYISTKFLGVPTSDFSSSEGGAYEEGD
jgi:hypothetical protein